MPLMTGHSTKEKARNPSSVFDVVYMDTAQMPARRHTPAGRSGLSFAIGRATSSSPTKIRPYASCTTSEDIVLILHPTVTESTLAPYAANPPGVTLHQKLMNHMPVQICHTLRPARMGSALRDAGLLYAFPNLITDLTHEIDPIYMDNFLVAEVTTGRMDGPFTVTQAHAIFGGHFRTAPLGLVEKPGSTSLRLIRHLSKLDHLGGSTNGWIDLSVNATNISQPPMQLTS